MADQEKLEKLEKALDGVLQIQGDIQKALTNGERVEPLAKDLDGQRLEIEALKSAFQASGETIPKKIEDRLSDIDRRLGRLNGPGGRDSVGEPVIEKSFGAQLTDLLATDPNFRAAAKGGKGTSRLELTGSTVRQHYAVLEAVKARGMRATDEEMVLIAKAMLLSDNATITPIQRLPAVMSLQGRGRKFLSDIIPTQQVEVGTLEYLEYKGLAPGTYLTATSISSSGTTATLTYTAHGARVGDRIHVKDSTDTDYNGFFIVNTVPTADTLTYTMAADPADDTADGTILWANLNLWGAAATVAENNAKPESQLVTRTVPAYIELIAHIFRISKQMLDDVPGMQAAINSAGVQGLQELKEYKLLYGDGTSNTILGFMNKPGVQAYTQAATGDLGRLVAFRHTLTMLENVGAMPSAAGINPSDRELYDTSVDLANRFYMEGAPSSTGAPVLWSVPLISTRWIAPGSILIGDFSEGALLLQRQGTQLSFSESDGDDFKYNRLAMRFEERLGLAITRPEYFVKLTLTT